MKSGNAAPRIPVPPSGYQKRPMAGFGCPDCGYQGWNAYVATGLDSNRQASAWFWCPSCDSQLVLGRRPWLWLGLRLLSIQIMGFSVLYALVMLVQHQTVPWAIVGSIIAAALCLLIYLLAVLRRPSSYRAKV